MRFRHTVLALVGALGALIVAASAAAPANAAPAQRFKFKDVATGACLDSNGAKQVHTLGCNGGRYQQWDGLFIST